MEKKKIICILIITVIILGVIVCFVLNNKQIPEIEEIVVEEKPFVEEKGIEILSAEDTYEIPVEPYAKDENKNIFMPDGVVFDNTKSSFTFYDYNVSEVDEEGYVTHTFKYDVTTTLTYMVDTTKTIPKWTRSFGLQYIEIFDYYTGTICKSEDVSLKGVNIYNVNTENENNEEKKMQYTNITWKDKEYKIGVRTETISKWDGKKEVDNTNGIVTNNDTNRSTMTVYVYAPYDFDGLMISIYNKGTNKDRTMQEIEVYNKYYELLKETENTGEKSDEFIKNEEMHNRVIKLFEYRYDENIKFTKDDFYVLRLTEIKKAD